MKIYTKGTKRHKSVHRYIFVDTEALSGLLPQNGLLANTISTAANLSLSSPLHETQVYSFLKTLMWIQESQDKGEIKELLTKNNNDLSISNVISGFKQLESIIYKRADTKRLDTISSNFRWFINKFGGVVLDNRPISSCGFRTRFLERGNLKENIFPHRITTTPPYIFKTIVKKNGKEKINYLYIDPDQLNGLNHPNSLLEMCISNASSTSYEYPITYSIVSSFMSTLELIINSTDAFYINALLSKKTESITVQDVRLAFKQLEDLIQKKGNNFSSSASFRSFLNKWGGNLSNGKKLVQSGFKSRFIPSKKSLSCIKPLSLLVTKQSDKDTLTIPYIVNTYNFVALTPPNSLMSITLLNAKAISQKCPIKLPEIQAIEEILFLINSLNTTRIKRLLISKPEEISIEFIYKSFTDLENIIRKNFPFNKHYYLSRIFRKFLCNYGETSIGKDSISKCGFKTRFSSTKKPTIPLKIKTTNKKNGKRKHKELVINLHEIDGLYSTNGILGVALHNAARSSLSNPILSSEINIFWLFTKKISTCDDLNVRTFLITPPNKITKKELIKSFDALEKYIEKKINGNDKYSMSSAFRSFLNKWGGNLSNNLSISQCRFKTRFKKPTPDINLIEPLDMDGNIKPSPIILKHESLLEIKQKIYNYYEESTQQILNACREEMDRYNKLSNEIAPLIAKNTNSDTEFYFQYVVPNEISVYTKSFTNQLKTTNKTVDLIKKYGKTAVLAGALQQRLKIPLTSPFSFPGQSYLIPEYVKTWFPKTGMTPDFVFCGTLLPRQILLVCFIRLTCFTTWNKDVTALLKPNDLPSELPDGPFELQGYKEKVDKPTSKVTIYPHQHEIREVIGLLIKHVANMKYLGIEQQTIWETKTSSDLSFLDSKFIKDFCKRSSSPTPYFTIEKLAKHNINVRYKIDGDLEKSRQERNHSKSKTTAGYMAAPLARIEYEANNAEFQRRFETTVQFRYAGEKSLIAYDMDPRDIDPKLLANPNTDDEEENTSSLPLFLLGDGSSCANIWAPVDNHNLNQKICRGRKCHKDGGCIYNKIILGPYEFSNTLRKGKWYISRSESLLNKYSREYFDTYIVPEMIFILGLTRYVENVNPSLYRSAQKLLLSLGDEKL